MLVSNKAYLTFDGSLQWHSAALNLCQEPEVASPKENKDTAGLLFKANMEM